MDRQGAKTPREPISEETDEVASKINLSSESLFNPLWLGAMVSWW
jgi:hypothetical protein